MENFESLALPAQVLSRIKAEGFEKPTPIQAQVIPVALEGRDIIATAQTGTGKTGAFMIPLIAHLINNENSMALVMVPTRELASQVFKVAKSFIDKKNTNIRPIEIVGGADMRKQLMQLKANPRLIIGTPGRIYDHLTRGSLKLNKVDFLVLDETDRMLDMGFAPQIEEIAEFIPEKRQTMLLSATLAKNIMSIAAKYLNNPIKLSTGENQIITERLNQEVIFISGEEKDAKLLSILQESQGLVIVFVSRKCDTEQVARMLRDAKIKADYLNGDLSHRRRENVIKAFRDGKFRVLVATDIASRGLDISGVEYVINYDLPQNPEDFIHRIGRTARAGNSGKAITFVSIRDKKQWRAINYLINPGKKFEEPEEFKDSRDGNRSRKPRGSFGGGSSRFGQRSNNNGGGGGFERSKKRSFGGGGSSSRSNDNYNGGGGSGNRERRDNSGNDRRDNTGSSSRREGIFGGNRKKNQY